MVMAIHMDGDMDMDMEMEMKMNMVSHSCHVPADLSWLSTSCCEVLADLSILSHPGWPVSPTRLDTTVWTSCP
jgi:hypothetical protein